jgi:hypothetical protein
MRSDNRKRHDSANPDKPKQRPGEHRQMGFLCVLTQGESIKDACALVGSPASRTSNRTTAKGGSRLCRHRPGRKSATRIIRTIRTIRTPAVCGETHAESAGYRNPSVDRGSVEFFRNPDKTDPGQASASPHTHVGSTVRNQIFHGCKVVGKEVTSGLG